MHGHWTNLPDDFNPDDWFGFIYLITHNETGRKYIGKNKSTHTGERKSRDERTENE